jgi:hypothetical protein
MTDADLQSKLAEREDVIQQLVTKLQETVDENDRLRAELANLTEGADAHRTLQSLYRNADLPESLRAKCAAASLPVEKPKLMSIGPPIELNRRERWRVFEMWSQRRQYIIEHRAIPPPGWDAHLGRDTFVEPEGTDMPPVDVIEDPTSGFKVLSNLLPKPGDRRIGGNGGDNNSND